MHMLLQVYSMLSEAEKLCLSWVVDRAPVRLIWSYQLEETVCKAACEGRIDVLTFMEKYCELDDGRHWVPDVGQCLAAAMGGQIAVLEWLSGRTYLDESSICHAAAEANQLETLRWLQTSCDPACPCDEETMRVAAANGHLGILKYLRSLEPACAWSAAVCTAAAANSAECLKWLRQQGCPWDAMCFSMVARQGELSLLQWMHAQDSSCPMDSPYVMAAAAWGNRLETMKWIRMQDIHAPWDESCTQHAVYHRNLAMLRWLRQQSPPCPWDNSQHNSCVFKASFHRDPESLELLQVMLQDHCPWRPECTPILAGSGNMATLQWLHGTGYSLSPRCLESAARAGQTHLLGWLLSVGVQPEAPPSIYDREWPIPALMLWADHHLPLSHNLKRQLQLARGTLCTLHGLIRWRRKRLATSSSISRSDEDSYPFNSHMSKGQRLLTHISRLPTEILVRIAVAADLQHDQPLPASATLA